MNARRADDVVLCRVEGVHSRFVGASRLRGDGGRAGLERAAAQFDGLCQQRAVLDAMHLGARPVAILSTPELRFASGRGHSSSLWRTKRTMLR